MADLSAESITRALTTRTLGHPVLYFERVGSTNDVAHDYARAGAPEGLLVVADEQVAGRGRLDRAWWSPPGVSLLFSLLLRPPVLPVRAGQLTMCLGLGAVEGVEEVTGLRPGLKWPNDLVIGSRKLGGMLSELGLAGNALDYAVLGLGLNVNVDFLRDGPAELSKMAASLSGVLGRQVPRLGLLAAILARTESWYLKLCRGELPYQAWMARLETLGQRVMVSSTAQEFEGWAEGATPEGALLVRDAGGELHTIWSGDVLGAADPGAHES